jgi:mRNA interferase MazF
VARGRLSPAGPRRGEVWLAELDKRRPVVVLTRDPLARILGSVIVGPITTRVRGVSTEVAVGPRDGVGHPSVVNLDHLQLLPRRRLLRPVGRAAPETMRSICDAVAEAIGCR